MSELNKKAIRALQLPETNDRVIFIDGVFSSESSLLPNWTSNLGNDFVTLRPQKDSDLTIVHVQTGSDLERKSIHVEIPAGVHSRVMEVWAGPSEHVTGRDLTVQIQNGATLEWICWQNNLANDRSVLNAELAGDANLSWFALQSNCRKIESPMTVRLNGQQAEARFFGLAFGDADSRIDQRIEIKHLQPQTRSRQAFKSLLRDRAVNIFAGKVFIAQDAQKSDASQRHQSLNFHSTAESITRPELEIFADDVKAAHGATVGRIDEDQVFYLQTRGVSRKEATELLARAFVQDILNHIRAREFYGYLDSRLKIEIPGFLSALEAVV